MGRGENRMTPLDSDSLEPEPLQDFDARVLPIVTELHERGMSATAIARILTARRVATRRGGAWTAQQVRGLLARAGLAALQRDGIAAAKAKGLYKGPKPTARVKSDQVRLLAGDGLSKVQIAQQLGISRRSVFRILATETQPDRG
jgi:hypothetical protein